MKIERKNKCQYCGREVEWFYHVSQKLGSSLYDVETMPDNKTGVYRVEESIEKNGYKLPLKVTVYCPYCNCLNRYEVKYKD